VAAHADDEEPGYTVRDATTDVAFNVRRPQRRGGSIRRDAGEQLCSTGRV
jgi:hypothetical protein